MDVKFLSASQTQATLIALVESCESMQWAVAWATENAVFDAAMKNSSKFEHFVVGTHMFQTQPEVLDRAASLAAAAVVPPTGDLFHPKVYLFRNGRRIRCVIGSPNLTKAAMNRNIEASVLLDGSSDDTALAELSHFVADAWQGAEDISHEFLYRYRHQYAAKAAAREELARFADVRPPSKPNSKRAPHDMSWADYLVQVRSSSHPSAHLFEERLEVLNKARALFTTGIPYAKWGLDDRKLVAGTLGRKKSQQPGVDYGLFGSMGASGTFSNLIIESPTGLSDALDFIPLMGAVTQDDYDRYCKAFIAAFDSNGRVGGLPTATRLLAMKRPDTFVCIDSANRKDLCENFGVSPSTTNLENYWQRIIEPMHGDAWWRHPQPRNVAEAEIWLGRAALLDAIYYTPS
ncbi:phospholipase D family protein [Halopseudomonas pelagia]|uniref:phospholipase D family protein n=1 Tax=Halopseudomonas pelagia TaxID=553151 RepID=UPI0030D83311|tara:strand:+ start:9214 stop:10425 length:1212 start_codon:yes stop_codon:yes gene_type:complete